MWRSRKSREDFLIASAVRRFIKTGGFADMIDMKDLILPEAGYAEIMKTEVEPYLVRRGTAGYCEREAGNRIFYTRYLAGQPRGIVVISHGFTETVEKYKENIYYFLKAGYHVYMPEHCGHGRSYRMKGMTEELSLVHIDHYRRYVEDLLFVSRIAAQEFLELPVYLYGHSMGGGIAAAAAAQAPELFQKVVLSSPMIRPLCGSIPWPAASLAVKLLCIAGKKDKYVIIHHPYEGKERFEDSASASRARFDYYQEKRRKEPLFQMCAASYGWFREAVRLNRYLQKKAWKHISCPVLMFQAEQETLVSKKEQERFIRKMYRRGKRDAKLIRVPGAKHEIFNADKELLEVYWRKVFGFLRR